MRESIEQRRRQLFVAGKHGDPFGERQIRGDDRRPTFVPIGDQIEEQLAAGAVERHEAELVDDERVHPQEPLLQARELTVIAGFNELTHEIGRAGEEELVRMSDSVCTGLQLVNFLQDPPRDLALGRVYLPQNDLARFGVQDDDLAGPLTDEIAALLRFEGDRARSLLEAGLPLGKALPGRAGMSVALYARGGLAALDALERAGWDVFTGRPAPTKWTFARLAALELFRR